MSNTIPFLSLSQMLDDLGYNWHSTEYYIVPDEVISQPQFLRPFRPRFYAVMLCTQGYMDLMVNGQFVHMEKYNFFAGGSNMVFQRVKQSDDCKMKSVFFTKEFLIRNFENFHQFESFHFFSTHFTDCIKLSKKEAGPLIKLYDILQEKRAPADSIYHIEIIRNLIFAYIYETAIIYQQAGIKLPANFSKEANLSLQFQNLVARNCMKEHRLQFYANLLFVTPKYLILAIKKATGKTPGQIIDDAIIIAAKIQLKNSALTIENVAESLHFADNASFSKFFKKHVGVSPLSFRKSANIM